jgi:hypothetical protein
MNRKDDMMAAALIFGAPLLVVLLFIAIFALAPDRGECLLSHTEHEHWTTAVQIGSISFGNGVSVPQYMYIDSEGDAQHCDKWEFPEGKK